MYNEVNEEVTYQVDQIAHFLNWVGYSTLSKKWIEDFSNSGTILESKVIEWFKRYELTVSEFMEMQDLLKGMRAH
ncbi:MAG: hypothetical protein RLZZ479_1078 [Bacteroidota bacterium]|jgi:hypothetical protein